MDGNTGAGRLERLGAAIALVERAICLAEGAGSLGAAFAENLEAAIHGARSSASRRGHLRTGQVKACNL